MSLRASLGGLEVYGGHCCIFAQKRTGSRNLPSASTRSHWWCSRSEEHTSELQSHSDLVCRLLREKKQKLPSRLRESEQGQEQLGRAIGNCEAGLARRAAGVYASAQGSLSRHAGDAGDSHLRAGSL